MSQEESDLRQCIANNTPVVGYEADPNYPEIVLDGFWSLWLKRLLNGGLPPGTRVLCGITLPAFT